MTASAHTALTRLDPGNAFRTPEDETGTVALVVARLSDWRPEWDELAGQLLSDAEQERAARFLHLEDVRRHLLGRLIVRTTAGEWLGRAPSSLVLREDAHDKPELGGEATGELAFNLSHGGDVVTAGFARNAPLGVDVEPTDRKDGSGGLARSVLTDHEFDRWTSVPPAERSSFFMHVWTAKESLIKATGEGLYRDPTTIECRFDGLEVTGFRRLDPVDNEVDSGGPDDWTVRPFLIGDDTVGAVTHPATADLELAAYRPVFTT